MKRFEVYKSIRKKAIIFGLPLLFFALLMISIVVSLLVVIFSFSFGVIIGVLIFNGVLYVGLAQLVKYPHFYKVGNVFPNRISNRRNTGWSYEKH